MNCSAKDKKAIRSLKLSSQGLVRVPAELAPTLVSLYLAHNSLTEIALALPLLKLLNLSHNGITQLSALRLDLPSLEQLLIHHNPFTQHEPDYPSFFFATCPRLRSCDGLQKSKKDTFRLDLLINWNGEGMQEVYEKYRDTTRLSRETMLTAIGDIESALSQNQNYKLACLQDSARWLQELFQSVFLYFRSTHEPAFANHLARLAELDPQVSIARYKGEAEYRAKANLYLFYKMRGNLNYIEQEADRFNNKQNRSPNLLNPQRHDVVKSLDWPHFGHIDQVAILSYNQTYTTALLNFVLQAIYKCVSSRRPSALKLVVEVPPQHRPASSQPKPCDIGRLTREEKRSLLNSTQDKTFAVRRESRAATPASNRVSLEEQESAHLYNLSQSKREEWLELSEIRRLSLQFRKLRGVFQALRDYKWRVRAILLKGKVLRGLLMNARRTK